jgi:DNA-binding NarL/FixJ family response regulator
MAASTIVRIAIVEDQDKIRQGLELLISNAPGFTCTGAYGSMEAALERLDRTPPDLALIDIGLPGISGIEGIRLLRTLHPKVIPLVLTVYENEERIFDALCAGACGYLVKGMLPARLLESLREAVEGGAPMSPHIARRVIAHFQPPHRPAPAGYDLTPHEVRILRLLVEGHHYQSAAGELRVSVNTVRFHLRNIYEKLQVHSKAEAVAKALRERIVR